MVKAKSVPGGNTGSLSEMSRPTPITIRDITGHRISREWAAEFRGWFWGEGSFKASHAGPKGASVSVGIVLGLRADDEPIVREFQRRLGGTLNVRPYRNDNKKLMARWQITDTELLPRIASILQRSAIRVPSNKARQCPFWKELIDLKVKRGAYGGSRYTPEERERRIFLVAEIKRLKHWGQ